MVAYKVLTGVNIALMCLLAYRTPQPFFRCYLIVMAIAAALQNSTHWGMWGEVSLALFSALWLVSELPRGRRAITEALALGLFVAAVLMLAVPAPWPNYQPAMYWTRLYSSALCVGIATPLTVLRASNCIIIIWFASVLIAGSQRGWDYVTVAVSCNLAWTACLLAWLYLSTKRITDEGNPSDQRLRGAG